MSSTSFVKALPRLARVSSTRCAPSTEDRDKAVLVEDAIVQLWPISGISRSSEAFAMASDFAFSSQQSSCNSPLSDHHGGAKNSLRPLLCHEALKVSTFRFRSWHSLQDLDQKQVQEPPCRQQSLQMQQMHRTATKQPPLLQPRKVVKILYLAGGGFFLGTSFTSAGIFFS